jgi:hypothetical protein
MEPTAGWSSRGGGTQRAALRDGLSNRPDVILSLHLFAAPGDLALARTLRRPWVQWVHAMELPRSRRWPAQPFDAPSAPPCSPSAGSPSDGEGSPKPSPAKSPPSSRLGKQEHV